MALPLFPPERDPGPDFVGLLRLTAGQATPPRARRSTPSSPVQAPHGTTVVALRYADGVVMAGDRRATAGNIIAHHAMEKVFPADRYSAVAIAGTAGMAIEMVRLFQVQLEHYEKVEGSTLSLEGKANQLAQMVRQHLPLAMQGLAVVPLFAGYDTARGHWAASSTTTSPAATTRTPTSRPPVRVGATPAARSSSAGGRAWPRRGRRPGHPVALRRGRRGLRHRRPRSGARHLPDHRRGRRRGYREVPEDEVAERFGALIARKQAERASMSMPYYVAPEQVMKDRAEYAQKGIARGRSLVATTYDVGIAIVAENPSRSLHKISEIYDRIAFGGVGKYNEYDQLRVAGVRHADTKGYAYSREDVDARSLANLYAQYLGNVFTHEMKPLEVEILVAELGEGENQLYHIAYEGTITDEDRFAVLGGDAETITERVGAAWQADWDLAAAVKAATAALAGPDRTLGAGDLEVAILSRGNGRRTFRRIEEEELAQLLA